MNQKASDLFRVCDKEDKGFVTKRDMQRMRSLDGGGISAAMDPEQLESVFDTLDIDGNGYLTLDEFAAGFQHFLGVPDDSACLDRIETLEVKPKCKMQLLYNIVYRRNIDAVNLQSSNDLSHYLI